MASIEESPAPSPYFRCSRIRCDEKNACTQHARAAKVMPPFGRNLSARRINSNGEVFLYFGDGSRCAWQLAKFRDDAGLPVLLLPGDKQANAYTWPLSGWDVLAIQVGAFTAAAIPKLALTLMNAGANIVRVIPAPDYRLVIFGGGHG